MVQELLKNLRKDFLVELRSPFALNISLAFSGIITVSISLVAGGVPFSPKVQSILFWIIIFFSAMNGLAHIFVREEEEKTALFLRLNSSAEMIYLSKLIYNSIFFFIIQLVVTPLFIFFLQVEVTHYINFILIVLCGGLALASSTTILGAMVAQAGGKGSLFTVISFPLVLPILWVAISTTTASLESPSTPGYENIIFLLAFSGAIIGISYLLFRFIWIEN